MSIKTNILVAGFMLASVLGASAQSCVKGNCPASMLVHHQAGLVAPRTVDITYGLVSTALSGAPKCWITRNLGAGTQASSASDASDASAGWYWQFNRKRGYGMNDNTRIPATKWTTNISEDTDWLLANDPCRLLLGGSWRLPTNAEWAAADAKGVSGGWDNSTEAYMDVLKLHAAGCLRGTTTGSISFRGKYGYYWSSTQGDAVSGCNLNLTSGVVIVSANAKSFGFPLRCLRDL